MSPRVVLVGPPGAGKTTVGRILAARLGVGFRDTDEDVEAVAGKTIAEVFFDDGEPAFRALEEDAVAKALAQHAGVLCLGGGAVLSQTTRALLKGENVIFLNVGLSDALARTGLNQARPLLAVAPRATLRALLEERLPLYREVATLEIATDGREPDDVADESLCHL